LQTIELSYLPKPEFSRFVYSGRFLYSPQHRCLTLSALFPSFLNKKRTACRLPVKPGCRESSHKKFSGPNKRNDGQYQSTATGEKP
jgi:hypothetical protein